MILKHIIHPISITITTTTTLAIIIIISSSSVVIVIHCRVYYFGLLLALARFFFCGPCQFPPVLFYRLVINRSVARPAADALHKTAFTF